MLREAFLFVTQKKMDPVIQKLKEQLENAKNQTERKAAMKRIRDHLKI